MTPTLGIQVSALEFRKRLEGDGKIAACKFFRPECETEDAANAFIRAYIASLFRARRMAAAGIVLWGERIFNVRPASAQSVWRAIEGNPKVLVPGGSSMGKSYTGICWTYLDWQADPEFTTVKLISTTGGHAKANTFGTIANLHRQAIVPMPGVMRSESLSLYESDKRACISIVRIREGEDNSEVLQGFHPLPRPEAHPIYGESSRVRAVLDEAEGIPNGVWRGIDNMLGSRTGSHSVKVFAFFNPKDISSKCAQLAEPVGGWGELDLERGVKGSNTWISRKDWMVVRLDPKTSENVQQRKLIYPGFQTYEGYRDYEKEKEGQSISYFVFGRGAYPPDGAVSTVISQRVLNNMRGEFVFTGPTVPYAGADIAIDGRDRAIYAYGRRGRASAFVRHEEQPDGTFKKELLRFREERECIQLDQLFSLPKGSPKIVGDACKATSIRLGVPPENFMGDETGNGSQVIGYLQIEDVWSPRVQGINFSKPATSFKILEEDRETPEEKYDGIHTEVWFAVAKLAEFGYLAIAPTVRSENLEGELVGRRYLLSLKKKQGVIVEDKKEYKKRLGMSPDEADAFTIFVHRARISGGFQGTMTGKSRKNDEPAPEFPDPINNPQWFRDDEEPMAI